MREGRLTRRALFGGSLALAVTACEPFGSAESHARGDPDVDTVRRALAGEEELLARYEAVLRRHPQLASRLDAFAAEHRAHRHALRARVSPSPSPISPSAAPVKSPRHSTVPPDSDQAISGLAEREQTAAAARLDDLATAPPFLAQLLASIAAAEATHAALLGEQR